MNQEINKFEFLEDHKSRYQLSYHGNLDNASHGLLKWQICFLSHWLLKLKDMISECWRWKSERYLSFTNSFPASFWKADATFSHQSVISDCCVWSFFPDASTLSWRAEVEAADNVNLIIRWWFISNFIMTFPQVAWVWLSSNAHVSLLSDASTLIIRSGGECEGKFNMMFYFKFGHDFFLRSYMYSMSGVVIQRAAQVTDILE